MGQDVFLSMFDIDFFKKINDIYKHKAGNLDGYAGKEILVIGPEGGFSRSEREAVAKKYGLKAKNILRSQTAILGVTAKILI